MRAGPTGEDAPQYDPIMESQTHWENVYRQKRADEVSWFQREPTLSLALIRKAAPDLGARIIDVGGGASSLVDALINCGYEHVTVLDVADAALAQARARLGPAAAQVSWRVADVLTADLPAQAFDVWHDRAVFHFLTEPSTRAAYLAQVQHALQPNGHLVIATFAEDGPTACSGLPVARYSVQDLAQTVGSGFALADSAREQHVTPSGGRQSFVYGLFRRHPSSAHRP